MPEPKEAPYRVEVESERMETVRQYGVMGPDGYLQGKFFEEEEGAEDLADTLNAGWLAGVAAERERGVRRLVEWLVENGRKQTNADHEAEARRILEDR